jgi:hypothetical protein
MTDDEAAWAEVDDVSHLRVFVKHWRPGRAYSAHVTFYDGRHEMHTLPTPVTPIAVTTDGVIALHVVSIETPRHFDAPEPHTMQTAP